MANPWDPPALPERGDYDDHLTYAGVGFVMSRWEGVEVVLAGLYSTFAGGPDSLAAFDEYGKGRIFRERLATLEREAADYFVCKPSQRHEGEFEELRKVAAGFADRRNDVAHGFVYPVDRLAFFRTRFSSTAGPHYAVIPPLHAFRKFDHGMPRYVYTSVELRVLGRLIAGLQMQIADFRKRLPQRL